jgi:ParB-like chromosome segregation protein Spo0J
MKKALSWIDPRLLKPNPLNFWLYEEREDRDFLESVGRFGVLEPLVVNHENVILSGYRLWKANRPGGIRWEETCP